MSVFGELAPVEVGARKVHDLAIAALWREKHDTVTIAKHLALPESIVANRLAAIRDKRIAGTR